MTLSILVVGAAGYVGSHATKFLLSAGHRVLALDNLSRGHRDAVLGADFVQADLTDAAGVAKVLVSRPIDVVMHFAALAYVGESVSHPRAYYRNNLVGALNLLDAMLDANVHRLVFSSTCSTYGVPLESPIPESHPQRPINPYGATKLAVEGALRDYAKAYGLSSVSLRYFNAAGCDSEGLLGERHEPETHLIPLVLKEALRIEGGGDPSETSLVVNGGDFPTPDGTCVRDYVHVEDLAAAHLAAALRMMDEPAGTASAFNLGTGRGYSVLEVIEAARRVTGIAIGYRMGPPREGDPSHLVSTNELARRELGWAPRYTNLDDIIATAWRWMKRPASPRP
ncbi:MAG TPA: UDP-glucose 4-epimerase GalE [Usitatibacter sp.]|nr:UDP-glucose 4-epimerase GalE [Usitatibacter sp.]